MAACYKVSLIVLVCTRTPQKVQGKRELLEKPHTALKRCTKIFFLGGGRFWGHRDTLRSDPLVHSPITDCCPGWPEAQARCPKGWPGIQQLESLLQPPGICISRKLEQPGFEPKHSDGEGRGSTNCILTSSLMQTLTDMSSHSTLPGYS